MQDNNGKSQARRSKWGGVGNQSLERGLQMLDLLDRSPEPLGIRELARRMEVAPSMVQRLANTLSAAAYVEQAPESQRYRIGPRSIGLGSNAIRRDRMLSEAQR